MLIQSNIDANEALEQLNADGHVVIPNLIDKNVTRTAFSFLISEYKDYATGIVDASIRSTRASATCRSIKRRTSTSSTGTAVTTRSTG